MVGEQFEIEPGTQDVLTDEPGGARFLAFGVDPDFNNAVDGLVEVDLTCIRPRKRQRYLGDAPAALPREEAA